MKIKSDDIKLKEYEQYFSSLPFICTEKIESEKTVFVMIDIINGFIRKVSRFCEGIAFGADDVLHIRLRREYV